MPKRCIVAVAVITLFGLVTEWMLISYGRVTLVYLCSRKDDMLERAEAMKNSAGQLTTLTPDTKVNNTKISRRLHKESQSVEQHQNNRIQPEESDHQSNVDFVKTENRTNRTYMIHLYNPSTYLKTVDPSTVGKVTVLKDENGETFEIVTVDDLIMPTSSVQMGFLNRLGYVKDFPYEEGDVLLCTYPKTGTHWTTNLLHFLRHEGPLSEAYGFGPYILDFPIKKAPPPPGARNVVSHLPPKYLPTEQLKPGRKVILVFRNPKDTAVSMYHALSKMEDFKLSWNCFIDNWLQGTMVGGLYFDYYNVWQNFIMENPDVNVLIVNYEDLKRNGVRELRKISKYLGLTRTDERLQEVIDRCSLRKLKADVESGKTVTPFVDKKGKSTLYRKGIIGDWKNMFTYAQYEKAEQVIQEKFGNSIFKYQI